MQCVATIFPVLVAVTVVGVVLPGCVNCQPPPRCCMPRKFQAVMSDLMTITGARIGNRFVTVDQDTQKQAVINTAFDPVTRKSEEISRTVFDFSKKLVYTLPAGNPTQCIRQAWNFQMFDSCVPADATYLGSSYIGLPGSLNYDGWKYPYPGTGNDTTITVAFSREGCVPIVIKILGNMNGPVDSIFLYNTYVPDNIDPTVFELPASCNA